MANLAKIQKDIEEVAKKSAKVKVGSLIVGSHGEVRKVIRVDKERYYYDNQYDNGERFEDFAMIENLDRYDYNVLNDITEEELTKQALEFINNPTEETETPQQSDSTDLMIMDKNYLISLRESLSEKRALVESKMRVVEAILSSKRSQLMRVVDSMKKQMSNINKVLFTIELYIGINEDVYQIRHGELASKDEPISFRQLMLYMDEEISIFMSKEEIKAGGFDFRNIESFDRWVAIPENTQKIIPEQKGMVVLRVRRRDKEYSKDFFENQLMNEENRVTYLLIRNGDNLFRIYTPLEFADCLFPKKEEIATLMGTIDNPKWNSDATRAENKIFKYKQQIILMQGLIDRTTLFHPLKNDVVKITDPEAEENGYVKLIYDGESLLTDGRLSWKEYTAKNRQTLKEGCRVITNLQVDSKYSKDSYYTRRFERYYSSSYSCPNEPHDGMYTIYNRTENNNDPGWGDFKIMYNPKDEIVNTWDRWDDGHVRKNNISFKVYKYELLNVDEITIDDIDYYRMDRVNRHEYLKMLPILQEAKEFKIKEQAEEKDFITMMIDYLEKEKFTVTVEDVEEAIKWWKLKNKWKRSLKKDDNLAFKMIYKKLKKV